VFDTAEVPGSERPGVFTETVVGTLLHDIRFGGRMLWKHRLTTIVSLVALALGIGANTAIFSVAEAFLLHPVPFENAGRMVALISAHPQQHIDMNSVAPATFLDWQKQAKSFDELGAYAWGTLNLTGDSQPQRIQAFDVSANLFHVLGVQPQLGRGFLPQEEVPGADREIILSQGLWERRYASNPEILNNAIKVDGKNYTVVGVMGKGFDFPLTAEAWIPLALSVAGRESRSDNYLWVVGHLRPGVSFSSASAEMQTIFQRLTAAYPDNYSGWQLKVISLAAFVTGDLTAQYTLLLLGAVAFVLLIACVNVANVQFARVTGRSKELAIRSSLGGSRWRIVRQLLTESTLLSLAGAGAGLLLARWEIEMIVTHMPADVAKFIAGWRTISLDFNAFIFTMGIAIVSGIVSGIAPALLSSRSHLGEALKESARGSSVGAGRHRMRSALVMAEVALALILLVGAGLLVKNFRGLLAVNGGYSPQTLLTMNLTLPDTQYQEASSRLSFHEQALQRLAAVPGVQTAGLVTNVPYAGGGGVRQNYFTIEGRAPGARGELLTAIIETISPNYFQTLNIGLLDGRLLTDSDVDASPRVCVISKSLARRYFPDQKPLGRKIKVGNADPGNPWMTVVGLVNDVHYSWIIKEDITTIYRSFRQSPPVFTTLLLRTAGGDPLQLVSSARSVINALDSSLPLYNVKSMDRVITESIIGIAYVAVMMGAVGVIALVLASVGVYGVMSYAVSERIHEIGIRLSLGAETRDILRLVLRNGLFLTIVGLAIGLPLAFVMARGLSSLLFGVDAADPAAFVGLPLVLAAVATLACYLPARRASRVDPLQALRHE
jgi:putative ABC transport system permease protein